MLCGSKDSQNRYRIAVLEIVTRQRLTIGEHRNKKKMKEKVLGYALKAAFATVATNIEFRIGKEGEQTGREFLCYLKVGNVTAGTGR